MIKLALVNITKDMECPPLTLVYLASYLKKYLPEVKISIVDINFEYPLKKILEINPDIVGISSMSVKYNYARELAKQIKKKIRIPVLIGGVHISTCPESFDKIFDIAVIGEGEKTFLELMRLFNEKHKFNHEDLIKIRGLLFLGKNKRLINTGEREQLDLDEIPIPDRKFLNKEYFKPKISFNKMRGERVIEAGIMTSRGCPYRCIFCSTSNFWKRIRFHSPEHIAGEIEYLIKEFNVNYIVIYDDLFAADIRRIKKVYNILKKKKIIDKVKFTCSLRANVVTDELCLLLKNLGIITVNFGFESGSERVLKYLKGDSVSIEQNKKAVLLCKKYGFDVTGSFMMGSPTETIGDMKKTLELMDWMKKQGAVELWCGVTKPYPATQLWDYGIKNNLFDKNLDWNLVDPSYVHNPVFLDKKISKKEFFKVFREAKYKSLDMSLEKKSKFARKIKDIVYYNKCLYDLAKKIRK